MGNSTKQLFNFLFSKEETGDVEKETMQVLFYKVLNKINTALAGDAETFNQFIVEGKVDEALGLLKNKNIDLKSIVTQSQKELSEDLGIKLSTVLEEIENTR